MTSQQLMRYQQTLDDIAMKLPQNDRHLPRFPRQLTYFHRERSDIIINNLVACNIAQTVEAPAYAHDFIEHLVADDKTVIDSITAVSFSKHDAQQLAHLGQSLATVSVFADLSGVKGDELIRAVLRKEMATATPGSVESKRKLMHSFGSFIVKYDLSLIFVCLFVCFFESFVLVVCHPSSLFPSSTVTKYSRYFFKYYVHDYLVVVLKPHVDQIRKGKVFGKLNKKGLQFCSTLLASMKSNLAQAGVCVFFSAFAFAFAFGAFLFVFLCELCEGCFRVLA